MGKIAIVFGGDSLEHDISIVTAFFVMEECKKHNLEFIPLYLSRKGVFYTGKALLNKENYQKMRGFKQGYFKPYAGFNAFFTKGKRHVVECALLCVHGANVEDGTLGAYFDILKIPCTYSGVMNASLMQDKHLTKLILKSLDIPVVDSLLISKSTELEGKDLTYPKIVKPVHLGSSIGVKKVENYKELLDALEVALTYDDSALIEDVVENLSEVNIAVLGNKDDFILSVIEEVNVQDKVLSFADKYQQFQGKVSDHIIPAPIGKKLVEEIKQYTSRAFTGLDCSGVMRFDYLLNTKTKKVYLNEINAIPGSLAFYLFEATNVPFIQLIERLVMIAKKRYKAKRDMITSYELSDLQKIGRKK